jgi:N utilization substance protein A
VKLDLEALQRAEADRNILGDAIIDAISAALLTAYRDNGGSYDARIDIDETGEVRVLAQEVDVDARVISEWDDTPQGFGQVAASKVRRAIRNTHPRDGLEELVNRIVREEP